MMATINKSSWQSISRRNSQKQGVQRMITEREPIRRGGLARKSLLIATTALPALFGCGHALAQDAATMLDPINVQDRVESAFGPVKAMSPARVPPAPRPTRR